MVEYSARDSEQEAKALQLLDHLLDQWLMLADTFKNVDPILAKMALEALDERLDEFAGEIDPIGWDREWYEIGRQLFRRTLLQRLNGFHSGQTRLHGCIFHD